MRFRLLFSLAVFFVFYGCKHESPVGIYPKKSAITGLATPVKLNPGSTEIFLTDFFDTVARIDSLGRSPYFALTLLEGKAKLRIDSYADSLPFITDITLYSGGFPYSLVVMKPSKVSHTFTFNPGDKTYRNVSVFGEINGWNRQANPMKFENGRWTTTIEVNPGIYQYLFFGDGEEIRDPDNPDKVDNNMGNFNNIVRIGVQDPAVLPFLYTTLSKVSSFEVGALNKPDKLIALWQNQRIPDKDIRLVAGRAVIPIPPAANTMDRSYIRLYAYNQNGKSNELLVPLAYGKVMEKTPALTRADWHSAIIYFLMVDRFNNGDTANDKKVDDPEVLPKANYFGGDLTGVTQKINDGFFKEMGISTIWLSPITQNPEGAYGLWPEPRSKFSGYHGYWPVSSSKVDHRFGNEAVLKELVETAHANNLNVILDYVANHVHEEHPLIKQHPDWKTELQLPDGSLNLERWDEYRLTTWFDKFLPTLDFSKPEVVDLMTDSALFWVEHYNLDGFRHDATKHIQEEFWRSLTAKLKKEVVRGQQRHIYQIGETYGSPELIASYLTSGMMDGQFDFNVYDAAVGTFAHANGTFNRLNDVLGESFRFYGNHNLMGYITGNQDRARFISYAGGGLKFDEDAKMAGWTRDVGVGDPVGYKRLAALMAFNMTIPGIPCIYYGDEHGDPGGNDPDNRRQMRFSNLSDLEKQNREITKKLTALRRNNMPLMYGTFEVVKLDGSTYMYARSYFGRTVITAFNKSAEPVTITFQIPEHWTQRTFKANFGNSPQITDNTFTLTLPGESFEVLN